LQRMNWRRKENLKMVIFNSRVMTVGRIVTTNKVLIVKVLVCQR